MKKLLGILVLGLLWSNITFAEFKLNPIYKNNPTRFNYWLYANGHHQYLNFDDDSIAYRAIAKNKKDNLITIKTNRYTSPSRAKKAAMTRCKISFKAQGEEMQKACYIDSVVEEEGGVLGVCATEPKWSPKWFTNSCDKFQGSNNLNIKFYKEKFLLPYQANPNRDTLIYYLWKSLYKYSIERSKSYKFIIQPSKNPYEFKSDLREGKFVKKQMQEKAVLSYLLFEDDKIVIDEISPKDRFGEFIDNTTKFRSNSAGKSIVGYIAGHAICAGYIDSVESKIDDWPLLKGTLYDGQKLIDILNMNAGDQKYVYDSVLWDGEDADSKNFAHYMKKMQGKKKSKSRYNYNVILTSLIFNYILFKSGDDFEKLLNDVFQKKVRIKDSVYFQKNRGSRNTGTAHNMFFATRYDYLRLAKAILDDWQNDTCVGKYLKTIYKNRIKKNMPSDQEEPGFGNTYSYGGQFHLDYRGLKNRIVFTMHGYAGQVVMVDVETSTIVVLNSLHYNNTRYKYNVKKLLVEPFKKK